MARRRVWNPADETFRIRLAYMLDARGISESSHTFGKEGRRDPAVQSVHGCALADLYPAPIFGGALLVLVEERLAPQSRRDRDSPASFLILAQRR